ARDRRCRDPHSRSARALLCRSRSCRHDGQGSVRAEEGGRRRVRRRRGNRVQGQLQRMRHSHRRRGHRRRLAFEAVRGPGTLPGEIDKRKDDIAKASNPEMKARLESNLQQAEAYAQELRQMKPALPTRTVSTTVTLKEQGREIQLHVLGRAHTDGDLFIYLPKEKVVATGDALIDWMPFLNDGYPEDWVQTLSSLEKLDFAQIIPGHGDVRPKNHLTF